MDSLFKQIYKQLIVSCQAERNSPFNTPEGVTMFAKSAMQGGAAAIRSEGIEKTKMIVSQIPLPVIGLVKSFFDDGSVRITGSTADVEQLISTKCSIIAIDGTFRLREGISGSQFIKNIKSSFSKIIMADIATVEEGIACANAGADCLSTTLSGYTPETFQINNHAPDYKLVEELVKKVSIPVFAEGRITSPEIASTLLDLGAWGVVVGSAITRPAEITSWFVNKLSREL